MIRGCICGSLSVNGKERLVEIMSKPTLGRYNNDLHFYVA